MRRDFKKQGPRLHSLSLIALMCFSSAAFADSTHVQTAQTGLFNNWSYGWKTSLTGTFTPFTTRTTWYALPAWTSPTSSGYPLIVANNTSATTRYSNTNFHVPKGQLVLHPSPDRSAVVRWISDESASYQIQGLFDGLDTCGPTVNVHIVLNSSVILFSQSLTGPTTATFNLARSLTTGDTLDFVVDSGTNQHWCDTTGLSATMTSLH